MFCPAQAKRRALDSVIGHFPVQAVSRVLVTAFGAATHRRLELLFFGGVSVSTSAVGIKMPFFQTEITLFLTVLSI